MRVVVVTIGSRDDVAPFVGLGRAIAGAGHEVSLATHESFRRMIEGAGLGFRLIPGDIAPIISVPSTDRPPSTMFMRHRVKDLAAYLTKPRWRAWIRPLAQTCSW